MTQSSPDPIPLKSPEELLAEANPASLDALFSRDPESLTDNELDRMVEEERRMRAIWAKNEAEGKRASSAKPKAAPPPGGFSLKDLGLA